MTHTAAILDAVTYAAQHLLSTSGYAAHMETVLARLGTAAQVSRAYVFHNHTNAVNDLLTSQDYEWAAPGIAPQIHNPILQNFSYRGMGCARWCTELAAGRPVMGNVSALPEQERALLSTQGIRSILIVPIHVRRTWWGFIGFDDCRSERTWLREDVCALQAAASILGAAIEHAQTHDEHQRLVTAVEQMGESVVITDAQGVIQYINPACEQLLGYRLEEVRGRTPQVWSGGTRDAAFYDELWATIRAGKTWRGILHNRARDGTLVEEEAIISPVLDKGGQIVNYVKIAHDVREQRRMQSIAAAMETMNTIGYAFAGVRHEIGNAVTALKIAVKLLGEHLREDAKDRMGEILSLSKGELQRIEDLLNRMRTFNVQERVSIQPVVAAEFLPECVRLMQDECRQRGIVLETVCDDASLRFSADPRLLHQVLLNLIVNAIDAVEQQPEPVIRIVAAPHNDYVDLRVEDNGCGMDDTRQQELFKPFVTTKPHGTGLGLILARNMLAQMNGTIMVHSAKNCGTVVTITLMRNR